jgi:Anti-sigma factor NepR
MHPREGDEDLREGSDSDPSGGGRDKPRSRRPRKSGDTGRSKASEVGKALRSVYDTTLREDVPRDFLDLLGKLS